MVSPFARALAIPLLAIVVVVAGAGATWATFHSASVGSSLARGELAPLRATPGAESGASTASEPLTPRASPPLAGGPGCALGGESALPTAVTALAASIDAALGPSCQPAHDEAVLNFLSNSSYSGSHVEFNVVLPPSVGQAGTMHALAFGMWVAGVPCSYGAESYLEVVLIPPDSTLGSTPNSNWTVMVQVDDLVPAGSCDPRCTNDTAYTAIDGIGYCEDDVLLAGFGSNAATGRGEFAPGHSLTVDLAGAAFGPTPMSVWVNDSARAGADVAWTLGGSSTVTGMSITPFYDAAGWTDGGWGYGLDVAAIWENCPVASLGTAPTPCNSYDGTVDQATAGPAIGAVLFWDPSYFLYDKAYSLATTTSSTGGCSGAATVAPCADFSSFGGTGTGYYPSFSLHAFGGASWWQYGGLSAYEVAGWGGPTAEFSPTGSPTSLDPTTVFGVTVSGSGYKVDLAATAADPTDIAGTQFSGYYCFGSSTASVSTVGGTANATIWDSPEEGNWTASFSTTGYTGTFYYSIRAESTGGVWSSPVTGSVNLSGGPTACSIPAPSAPGFSGANLTVASGGYILNWTESSPGVLGFNVDVNASGNSTVVAHPAGGATSIHLDLGRGDTAYEISIVAISVTGATTASTPLHGVPTLPLLSVAATGPTGAPIWHPATSVMIGATAVSGEGPYVFTFSFGDGSTTVVGSSTSSANATHDFGTYFGDAIVTVSVADRLNDTASSSPLVVPIWATPLGAPQMIAAGDGQADVTDTLPASPGGTVVGYTVFWTTNASAATILPTAWPSNGTIPGVTVWNTTNPFVRFAAVDGLPIYAQVVARNEWGAGALPPGDAILTATPAPFSLGPILGPAGGPAPFVGTFSAFVTNGTNDPLSSATFSVGIAPTAATVVPAIGGQWVNATITIPTSGVKVVVLHVSDSFSSVALGIADVLVTPGVGPTVTLIAPTLNGWFGWAGSPLSMGAAATGGTGPYNVSWDFGDGNTAVGPNVTHAYADAGNYTMNVRVTDVTTGGTSEWNQPIQIYALPTVAIASAPGPDGALSFAFTAIEGGGSGPGTFSWSFGDGNVATGTTVSHDYIATGTYTVNVSVHDPQGRSGTGSVVLAVGGGGAGSGSGGTFLGANAGVWGPTAIGLAALVVILLILVLYVYRRGQPPVSEDTSRPPFRDRAMFEGPDHDRPGSE